MLIALSGPIALRLPAITVPALAACSCVATATSAWFMFLACALVLGAPPGVSSTASVAGCGAPGPGLTCRYPPGLVNADRMLRLTVAPGPSPFLLTMHDAMTAAAACWP